MTIKITNIVSVCTHTRTYVRMNEMVSSTHSSPHGLKKCGFLAYQSSNIHTYVRMTKEMESHPFELNSFGFLWIFSPLSIFRWSSTCCKTAAPIQLAWLAGCVRVVCVRYIRIYIWWCTHYKYAHAKGLTIPLHRNDVDCETTELKKIHTHTRLRQTKTKVQRRRRRRWQSKGREKWKKKTMGNST